MNKTLNSALGWFEIPVTDMPRAKRFYERILDIQMTELNLNESFSMTLFPVASGTVGGALCKSENVYLPSKTGIVIYLNADPDLQQALDKVEPAGGKVLKGKTHVSDAFGYMAFIEDTEGNRLALQSSN